MSRFRFFVDSARLHVACWAALALALPLGAACARDLVAEPGGWRSTRDGYRIGEPGEGWERFDLDGAALAFRHGKSETISLQTRCGRPVASPAIMARHLMIGIPERTLRQAGPYLVAGRSGWTQTFDARLEGRTVRIQTVTLVTPDCAYDFLVVAAGDPEPAQRDFEKWVESFALAEPESAGRAS
jgi:hypothetical protein